MRGHILIVDDDSDFLLLLQGLLGKAGYMVRTARDGYTALEELSAFEFDIVLLDISLPHVNGFQVLRTMRSSERMKSVPVIMLTASQDKKDLLRVRDQIHDYMIKLPPPEELLARIDKAIKQAKLAEISLAADDPLSMGSIGFSLRLVKVSERGLLLRSTIALEPGHKFDGLDLGILHQLQISTKHLQITSCVADGAGEFEVAVYFVDLTVQERARIRDWIHALKPNYWLAQGH